MFHEVNIKNNVGLTFTPINQSINQPTNQPTNQ